MTMTKTRTPTLQFRAVSAQGYHEDIGVYDTYGLTVVAKDGRDVTVWDVTTNHRKAERLAEFFTRIQLSPLHLLDVLEDML